MTKRIKLVGKRRPRVIDDVGSRQPTIDPRFLADALGAEIDDTRTVPQRVQSFFSRPLFIK